MDGLSTLTSVSTAVSKARAGRGGGLSETEVEYNPRRANPVVQEFGFRLRSPRDWGIEEVEIFFAPSAGGVEGLLAVDNRGGFVALGRERMARLRIAEADLGRLDLPAELRRAIDGLR